MNKSYYRRIGYTIFLGVFSATLYGLLWTYEDVLLTFSHRGGGYFIVPVLIAFIFSVVHGTFTSYFWDVFGIKAKH
jgi:hypothetical protein